jgi:protein ImuB
MAGFQVITEDSVSSILLGTEKLLGPSETLARNLLYRVKALGIAACATVSGNAHAAVSLAKGLSPRTAVRAIPRGDEAIASGP